MRVFSKVFHNSHFSFQSYQSIILTDFDFWILDFLVLFYFISTSDFIFLCFSYLLFSYRTLLVTVHFNRTDRLSSLLVILYKYSRYYYSTGNFGKTLKIRVKFVRAKLFLLMRWMYCCYFLPFSWSSPCLKYYSLPYFSSSIKSSSASTKREAIVAKKFHRQ